MAPDVTIFGVGHEVDARASRVSEPGTHARRGLGQSAHPPYTAGAKAFGGRLSPS